MQGDMHYVLNLKLFYVSEPSNYTQLPMISLELPGQGITRAKDFIDTCFIMN